MLLPLKQVAGLAAACAWVASQTLFLLLFSGGTHQEGLQHLTLSPGPGSGCNAHIRRVAVLGERHTGTNLAEKLLKRNLDESVLVDGGLTAHKHWMQPPPQNASEACGVLLVLPVRNPFDWARAMYRCCYCCDSMQSMDFDEFLVSEYKPTASIDAHGELCYTDVDIERGGAPFDNILSMRAAKVRHVMALAERWDMPLEIVRWEDMLQPERQVEWVEKVAARYRLPLRRSGHGCTGKAGGCGGDLGEQATGPPLQRQQQQEHEGQPGMRSMRSSRSDGSSSGGSSGGGTSGGGSGQPAAASAWQVQPVTEDARGWVKEAFTADLRLSTSLYLHPELVAEDFLLRLHMETVNSQLDAELEARLGYHHMSIPDLQPGQELDPVSLQLLLPTRGGGAVTAAGPQ